MKSDYFDSVMSLERLHRLFLSVIDAELEKLKILDISTIQCFILYNIAENRMTVGEISNRGYYLGSNVTYNLKKMVENGYVIQEQSPHDRRASYVKLSEKGLELYRRFDEILAVHAKNMKYNGLTDEDLKTLRTLLKKLESFWNFAVSHDVHH